MTLYERVMYSYVDSNEFQRKDIVSLAHIFWMDFGLASANPKKLIVLWNNLHLVLVRTNFKYGFCKRRYALFSLTHLMLTTD